MEAWERLAKESNRTGEMMPFDIFPTRVENNRLVGYIFDQPEILYETDGLISYRSYVSQSGVITKEIIIPRPPKFIAEWAPNLGEGDFPDFITVQPNLNNEK